MRGDNEGSGNHKNNKRHPNRRAARFSLAWRYARILGYYKRIELELKKDRGDTSILLERLLELKSDLKCLERALNGKYNIIVVRDSAGDNQKRMDKEA